jgi:hypothetical protein
VARPTLPLPYRTPYGARTSSFGGVYSRDRKGPVGPHWSGPLQFGPAKNMEERILRKQSHKNWRVWNIPALVILTMAGTSILGSNRFWTAGTFSAAAAVCITNPVVTTTADSGPGSLRQAIAEACPGSTITFAVTGTITLTSGALDIEESLTVQGPGAGKLTINGNNNAQSVFNIGTSNSNVDVTISALTITGGNAISTSEAQGGGILYNGTQTLIVTDCTVSRNQVAGGDNALSGGAGIFCQPGTLIVTDSTVSGNTASGGES